MLVLPPCGYRQQSIWNWLRVDPFVRDQGAGSWHVPAKNVFEKPLTYLYRHLSREIEFSHFHCGAQLVCEHHFATNKNPGVLIGIETVAENQRFVLRLRRVRRQEQAPQ